MSHQSPLFSSRGERNPSTPATDTAPHHATPEGWWNYENSCFVRTQQPNHPTALHYREQSIDSPYTPSPQIDGTFAVLPYSSSSFSQMQHQSRSVQPEFAFPPEPQIYEVPSLPMSPGWPMLSLESFDTNSWNEMILSALDPDTKVAVTGASSPSFPYFDGLLPCASPSPSLPPGRVSPASGGTCSPLPLLPSSSGSRRSSIASSISGSGKTCSHCAATSTPLWRRDPTTHRPLCNACGLYLQQRNKMRPAALIAADQRDDEDEGLDPDADVALGTPECSHCHTLRTSVWRRSKTGAKLCNACGVYVRLRGRDRPLSLRRNKIRPRCKHPKQQS
ncbi:hypothetical protein DFH08DRAFT_781055 [Mycena albidolilacea]|uniref:GATA-type domain-containing protein n=1 Tax=Mycena albidolilacea TaxID=1033008 RepID=A0AAD7EPV4_9AGAR|nr:hypothetical protein DFH08DRAFT_781055 [Mycena albidolilacea]